MPFFVLFSTLIQPVAPRLKLPVWDLDPIFRYFYTFIASISTIFLANPLPNISQHFTFKEQFSVNQTK
ncbi:hypothetical protein DXZ79_13210 [Yersinia rochesterensis]|uniref:Uncharacterized protein n=1 Tax=Yersinia rochesterensis TaxID=1604335 RepID=A0A8D4N506_9GAMM|nr:hypothetical protein DXZ79_13210 [Yersinia rochesterensis]